MTLSKIVLTNPIQDSANTESVDTFLSSEKCSECLPSLLMYFVELFLKLRTALLTGPAENCRISSPNATFNLNQKLFCSSDEGFKIASRVVPQT